MGWDWVGWGGRVERGKVGWDGGVSGEGLQLCCIPIGRFNLKLSRVEHGEVGWDGGVSGEGW